MVPCRQRGYVAVGPGCRIRWGFTQARRLGLKVLIICYIYPPEVAPAGIMVRELAEDFSRDGHEVTVQTGWPNHPRGELFSGYKVRCRHIESEGRHRVMRVAHAIYPKSSALLRLWTYLTFAVSSFLNGLTLGRQDVVVCLSTPMFGVWTAWLMAKLWRARFVNVIFDLYPEAIRNAGLIGDSLPYRICRWIDTRNTRWSDQITTLGEGMRQAILARGGIPEDKVRVVPFWLDTQRIRPLDRNNDWRREQGIPEETFIALFAGTIGYASGAQILAETARELRHRKEILLLIVGEGVVKDELRELSRTNGLDNIRFLPFQPEDRLAEVQSTADVGLLTLRPKSGTSSVPSKVLGYMAAGRPVIASAQEDTDTAKLIREADCGLVTPVGDGKAIAEAIAQLADAPSQATKFGQNARRHVVQHFSRGVIVREYSDLIIGAGASVPGDPPKKST